MRFPDLLVEIKHMQDRLRAIERDLSYLHNRLMEISGSFKDLPMAQDLGIVSRETKGDHDGDSSTLF